MKIAIHVVGGPDLGKRSLVVADSPAIIGRAADCDFRLGDASVSRRHVTASASLGGLRIEVAPGASPIVFEGREAQAVTVPLGGRFFLGSTEFLVAEPLTESRPVAEESTIRALFDGPAGNARGLGRLYALAEELASATARDELDAAFARWAAVELGAEIAFSPAQEGALSFVEHPAGRGLVAVLVPAMSPSAPDVTVTLPEAALDDGARRVLALAARVYASSVESVKGQERGSEERIQLRTLALGSAHDFLGGSLAAARVTTTIPKLALADATCLLLGESGSGKTFVARLIHEHGPRVKEPFRVVNCAAIPEALLEGELFGHERGAFTGADRAREGVFEAAGKGTVLLDEVGELPLASQAKLLRVLEDRRFERLGSTRTVQLYARVLAATNRDLVAMCDAGTFRRDLFYRISVVTLPIPSLHERREDVRLLATRILRDLLLGSARRVEGFAEEALGVLEAYPWPGNVRELRNAIEHALVMGEDARIFTRDLPENIVRATTKAITAVESGSDVVTLPLPLAALEARAIESALRSCGGNRTKAAALLGISRVTLYHKLKAQGSDVVVE